MSKLNIENKKAYHDYFVDNTIECGISLKGNEVKSIHANKCNLKDAWCRIQNGNLVIRGMHIAKWDTANIYDVDETRERQLLIHKKEINKLIDILKTDGITLIPLKIYANDSNKIKVLVGICRGKKNYDKREALKTKQVNRDIAAELKNKNR